MAELILYYSRADENYVNGALKILEKGNTEAAAELIQEVTGAELFRVEQIVPYSKSYNQCIEEAREDQRRDARPELTAYPENLDQYDTVYLGYPNYWSTMPMAMFTLLEKCDFSGKVIKPFCTHEGSGMGKSEADIKKLCPKAEVKKGLAIHGAKVKEAKKQIEQWLSAD